jgi:hypothetical protein
VRGVLGGIGIGFVPFDGDLKVLVYWARRRPCQAAIWIYDQSVGKKGLPVEGRLLTGRIGDSLPKML